jgi:hypothetical protein
MVPCFHYPPWHSCRATRISERGDPDDPPTGGQETTLRRRFHPCPPPLLSGPTLDRDVPVLALVRAIGTDKMFPNDSNDLPIVSRWV